MPGNGAPVFKDGKKIGVVTQAMYSPLNDWIVAIARLPVDCANNGTEAGGALRDAWADQGRDAFAALLRRREEAPHRQGLTAFGARCLAGPHCQGPWTCED